MPDSPLPLGDCRGPNSVTAGELRRGERVIAVSCAESRSVMLYQLGGSQAGTPIGIKGGWGAVALAKLTRDGPGALITANNEDASITIYVPE